MNAGIARTTKDTPRAEAQRERILCAAQRCFIEYGFHAASMASIAETAQMSAGLMYRYFENKSAIVLAIIERQLQEGRDPDRTAAFVERTGRGPVRRIHPLAGPRSERDERSAVPRDERRGHA